MESFQRTDYDTIINEIIGMTAMAQNINADAITIKHRVISNLLTSKIEIFNLNNEIQDLQKENADLSEGQRVSKLEIDEITKERDRIHAERNSTIEVMSAAHNSEIDEMKRVYKELEDKINTMGDAPATDQVALKDKLDTFIKDYQEIVLRQTENMRQIEEKEGEIKRQELLITSLNSEKDALNQNLAGVVATRAADEESFQQRLKQDSDEKNMKQAQLEQEYENRLRGAREQRESMFAEIESTLDEKIAIGEEVRTLRTGIDEIYKEIIKKVPDHATASDASDLMNQSPIKQLRSAIHNFTQEIDAKTQIIAELQDEAVTTGDAIMELREELKGKEGNYAELLKRLKVLKAYLTRILGHHKQTIDKFPSSQPLTEDDKALLKEILGDAYTNFENFGEEFIDKEIAEDDAAIQGSEQPSAEQRMPTDTGRAPRSLKAASLLQQRGSEVTGLYDGPGLLPPPPLPPPTTPGRPAPIKVDSRDSTASSEDSPDPSRGYDFMSSRLSKYTKNPESSQRLEGDVREAVQTSQDKKNNSTLMEIHQLIPMKGPLNYDLTEEKFTDEQILEITNSLFLNKKDTVDFINTQTKDNAMKEELIKGVDLLIFGTEDNQGDVLECCTSDLKLTDAYTYFERFKTEWKNSPPEKLSAIVKSIVDEQIQNLAMGPDAFPDPHITRNKMYLALFASLVYDLQQLNTGKITIGEYNDIMKPSQAEQTKNYLGLLISHNENHAIKSKTSASSEGAIQRDDINAFTNYIRGNTQMMGVMALIEQEIGEFSVPSSGVGLATSPEAVTSPELPDWKSMPLPPPPPHPPMQGTVVPAGIKPDDVAVTDSSVPVVHAKPVYHMNKNPLSSTDNSTGGGRGNKTIKYPKKRKHKTLKKKVKPSKKQNKAKTTDVKNKKQHKKHKTMSYLKYKRRHKSLKN